MLVGVRSGFADERSKRTGPRRGHAAKDHWQSPAQAVALSSRVEAGAIDGCQWLSEELSNKGPTRVSKATPLLRIPQVGTCGLSQRETRSLQENASLAGAQYTPEPEDPVREACALRKK